MGFRRRKHVFLSVEEFNEKLALAAKTSYVVWGDGSLNPEPMTSHLEDNMTKTTLTMRDPTLVTYVTRKDNQKMAQCITGLDAYTELAKEYRRKTGHAIPRYEEDEMQYIGSAVALLAYRPEYGHERIQAWAYDQNNSYGWAMTQPMPDTRELAAYGDYVHEGQIGFQPGIEYRVNGFEGAGTESLVMVKPGGYALYVFDLLDVNPFADFAKRWHDRKLNAQTPEEKAKAKQMTVYAVGYLQRVNPFLRAAIVGYANEYITSLIDEDTIYCNTDCIVSTRERNDLELGVTLGTFKLEGSGMFARSGFNYQWDLDVPVYRGIPKSWFPEGWDILKDPLPDDRNLYYLNTVTMQLEETEYGKKNQR